MFNKTVIATALGAALAIPHAANAATAADKAALAQIRVQIQQLKVSYEARIQSLEQRLQASEARGAPLNATSQPGAATVPGAGPAPTDSAVTAVNMAPAPAPAFTPAPADAYVAPAAAAVATPVTATGNGFNPTIALILGGSYVNLSQDPNRYRLQGFMPAADGIGPGPRGLNLGESELTLAANIDPTFAGQLTFSLAADHSLSVEEAFFRTQGLANGLNLKAGRFLSSIGYLNMQHAHTWDFIDAPLAYQAFLGGQYKPEGIQLRWLAPTERFTEVGIELGRGNNYPGNDRNRNGVGSSAVFAHVGDDIGDSASYRAGLSYLRTSAAQRSFDDTNAAGVPVVNAFSGNSGTLIADGIYKWAPNGNPVQTNVKLQGEYFRRTEHGDLAADLASTSGPGANSSYRNAQSGWYLQGIYQFTAGWRAGLRYDRLDAGNARFGSTLAAADFSQLARFHPQRATAMVDYSPSEFSRFRLQYAQDRSRPGASDNQIFLQYIMSLGAHGAHTF